eukprot:m.717746 g.717746  ORF g.717746 m.717746 type:complete len:261 (+) comp22988_c0_seq9:704-1486(+)
MFVASNDRQRQTTAHEAEQFFETEFSNSDTSSSCSHRSNVHRSADCRWRHDNGGDCGRRHGQQDVNCRVRWKNTSSEAEHREALPTFELTAPAFLSAASATGDSVSIDGYALRRNMFGPGVLRDFREEFECVSGAAERAKLAQFMTQAYAEGYSSKKPSKNERNVLLGVQHVTSVLQVGTRVHVIGEAQLTPSGILLTSRHDGSTVAPGSNGAACSLMCRTRNASVDYTQRMHHRKYTMIVQLVDFVVWQKYHEYFVQKM